MALFSAQASAAARVLLLDDLSDGGVHARAMKQRVLEQAPQAEVEVADCGADLAALVAALGAVEPADWDLLLLGVAHPGFDQGEYDALVRLDQGGLPLFAPAGNAGGVEPQYPASYPFVLSVGAADEHGHPAPFSSIHPNQKFLMPGQDGTSFAAAALAGQAARLRGRGVAKAGLARALLSRRRGHEAGPRRFEADDAAAARLVKPPKPSRRERRRQDHALLLAPRHPPVPQMIAQLEGAGAVVEHVLADAGAIVRGPAPALARVRGLPWVRELRQTRKGSPSPDPASARLAGLWEDLYWGGLEEKGLEGTLEGGGALVGCVEAPAHPTADPREPLRRQGRWAPSPPLGASYYDTSSFLAGRVSVGIFLAESNGALDPNSCDWTPEQEALVQAKITSAMDYLAAQNPGAQVEFVYDWHFKAACDYEPVTRAGFGFSPVWTQNVVAKFGFGSVREYNDQLRRSADADWAFSIFVANDVGYAPSKGFFTDGKFAFAYLGGPYQVMTYNNDNWGIVNMDSVCAHETGHIFHALDEYAGACNAGQRSGYFNEPNRNCIQGGSTNHVGCPMRGSPLGSPGGGFCPSSRLQLGWRDLDGDGLTDVLDTAPGAAWTAPVPAGGELGSSVFLRGMLTDLALESPAGMNSITLNAILGAEARLNGGPWAPVGLDDGAGDESKEAFNFLAGPLVAGPNLVELRAYNSAGNTQTAYLSLGLEGGSATATRTVSPSPSMTPSITETHTPGPAPTATWTMTEGPSPTPAPGCQTMPDLAAAGIVAPWGGGRFFLRDGTLHFLVPANSGVHIVRLEFGNWVEVAGSPFAPGGFVDSVIDPGSGDLWFLANSTTCPGCLPTGSLTAFRWDGSNATQTSVPWSGTFNLARMVFHQGRPWVVDGRGASGLLLLSYQGGAWVEEGLLSLPGGMSSVLHGQTAKLFSNGQAIVVPLYNGTTSAYEAWAYQDHGLSLLHDFGGTYAYSAGLAFDAEYAYLVFHGSHLRAFRFQLNGPIVEEVSEGLDDHGSFAYLDAYGGGEGVFVAAGRSHPQGPWVDHLRFNGTRWEPLNCGIGLPPGNVFLLFVEGGRIIHTGDGVIYDCPLNAPCPDPSPTDSPTAGPYYSPTFTPSASFTRTPSPWPTRTASPTFSPTPLGSFTPTPSPTPHLCGTVLRVCKNGSCAFSLIGDAIAAACPGDRIEVEGGHYVEDGLSVDKDLQITGVPGLSFDGPIARPVVEAALSASTLSLDLSVPRSVTITNLALRHQNDLDLVRVSLTAGSSLRLERLDLKGGTGRGVVVGQGAGNLVIQNCAFWGFPLLGGPAISVDTAVTGGQAWIRYNSFLAPSASTALSLGTGNAYTLTLLGNLAFNSGAVGTAALDLKGNPAASGDYQAWWGYTDHHGGLAVGANDLGPVLPDFGALDTEDPRYTTLSSLAHAGTVMGPDFDVMGNTRPAAGEAAWSIGCAEPVSPSPSPSLTRTPSPSPSASPSVSSTPSPADTATLSPTPSDTPTLSPTPSDTPTLSPTPSGTPTLSPTPTDTPTLSPTPSPSATPSATPSFTPVGTPSASFTLSPTPSPSHTPSFGPTISPSPSLTAIPDSNGESRILALQPWPNPGARVVAVLLSGPVDDVELSWYSPALVLLDRQSSGPLAAGWRHLALPHGVQSQQGLIYVSARAFKNGEALEPRRYSKLWRLP